MAKNKPKALYTFFNSPIVYNRYTFQLFEGIGGLESYLGMLDYLKNEASPEDYVTIEISNGGGSLFTGIELFYAIRNCPAIITTRVIGEVASAATIIALAGDIVSVPLGSSLMMHTYSSWHGGVGNSPVDSHSNLDKSIREFLHANINGFMSAEELDKMMEVNRDIYFSGEELNNRLISLYKHRQDTGMQKERLEIDFDKLY